MQYHKEFRCDPPQDRACLRRVRNGSSWKRVPSCASGVRLGTVARPGEGRVPTDPHVLDAVGSQVTRYRIRCILRPKNSEFLH